MAAQGQAQSDAMDKRAAFARDGYVVLRGWLPQAVQARFVQAYEWAERERAWEGEIEEPGNAARGGDNRFAYGTPILDGLLDFLALPVGRAIGRDLLPTYSYMRVYAEGAWLSAHRDRPSCEISLTTPLALPGQAVWPIWFKNRQGRDVALELRAGDLAIYSGCELLHWREKLIGGPQAHVFMHWVDANGANAGWKFDRRPSLGLPGHTRQMPGTEP